MSRNRYGEWRGGDDPLAGPYDLSSALDDIGDSVLDGMTPAEAMQQLMRRGVNGRRGLDDLLRAVRERARQARQAGRLDGTLEEVRDLLDRALEAERRELFPDPSDDARLAEAELDALPQETARAVRELSSYEWRSEEARAAYQEIQDLLRREVLDSQFRGMKDALSNGDPESQQRVKDMMSALNEMLDADARGEDTAQQFSDFMENYGEFFPDNPQNLEELIDSLARRAAAAQRLMNSLSPEQQAELAGLMQQAMADSGLAGEMARLSDQLRARRPELDWQGRQRMKGRHPTRARRCDDGVRGVRRPRRARRDARSGLPGREYRRRRPGAGRACAGPPGRRRPRGAAPGRTRARSAGLSATLRRRPHTDT
jgi:uncharacterized protein with von Willebrand factor type A (vWA) domain